ncbi:LysR family transcriptional regulator [Nocardioides alkalitolerans]|uniref:LysR family transcriptional regulator n=1 Tax=Nocardioides alkalitolerans TaxID=281714 RepID=UPI0003F8CD3B|nr:LysR family transcriptional regulator [Nocardioides alkalitolerans]
MKTPSFTLVQLRYFAAAAELGSMTAASRQLLVSQSAISTAVAQLERELGVQLLLRSRSRGLALTSAGRDFYAELRGFLAHCQELADSATDAGQELAGDLVVGCFETLAPFWLPDLVASYTQRHPAVRITAREGEHATLKRMLREGECEAALMYAYDLEDDLETVTIASAAPYVVLGVAHPLARKTSIRLADLASEPVVMLDLPHTADYFRALFETVGVQPQVRHRTRGYETVRAMVAAGQGFAILNQRPLHDQTYRGGSVVCLTLDDDLPPLDVVAVRVRAARPTRKVHAFIRTCLTVAGRNADSAEDPAPMSVE